MNRRYFLKALGTIFLALGLQLPVTIESQFSGEWKYDEVWHNWEFWPDDGKRSEIFLKRSGPPLFHYYYAIREDRFPITDEYRDKLSLPFAEQLHILSNLGIYSYRS